MTLRLPADTARLTFRCWVAEDLPLAIALWGDARVMAKIDARAPGADSAQARLELEIRREREHGVQYWPIFGRSDGAHVGCCGLRPYQPDVYELGFHLRPEAWGAGYATEAARAVIAHAFDERGAARLIAGHHPDNDASRRTLEKLGFTFTHRQLYEPTGREHPYYALAR